MKEIQISIKLISLKELNEKLLLRNEWRYYIEVFFASTRAKSKTIRKFAQDKSLEIPINQLLCLKHFIGNTLEFWFRSEINDSILGAFSIPVEQLLVNTPEMTEDTRELTLSSVSFAKLTFSYQISEKNIDKPIIIEKDEDLLKPPEEDKEELERKAKEKARLEQEYLEAQKKLLPKDSSIHLTNYYVKDKPFY